MKPIEFLKKFSKTLFPMLVIGGFFLILFVIFMLYQHSYNIRDPLAQFVSSEALMYAQLRDSYARPRVNNASDPFIKELYAFTDMSVGWQLSLEKDVLPHIKNEGAFILVDDGGIQPIILLKTKNPSAVISAFPNHLVLSADTVAFSPKNISLKKYIGTFPNTVENEMYKIKRKYSLVKIFMNFKKLNIFPGVTRSALIMLDKKEQWKFQMYLSRGIKQDRHYSQEEYIRNVSQNNENFQAFFHNIPANNFLELKNIEPFISSRAKKYATDEIFPAISYFIDFGINSNENKATTTFLTAFNIKESIDEDVFVGKLQTFLAYLGPEYEQKPLPDKTLITEEVLKPEKYILKLIQKSNGLYSIDFNKDNGLFYQSSGKKIIVSNSLDAIYNYSQKKNYDTQNICGLASSKNYIIVRSDFIKQYMPLLNNWEFLNRDIYLDTSSSEIINGCII